MELSKKKLKIIQIVEKLINKKDANNISIRDMAKAADINVSMISYYFGSKEKLVEAIIKYRYATMKKIFIETYNNEIKKEKDISKKLNIIIDLYTDNISWFKSFQGIIEHNVNIKKNCIKEIIDFHILTLSIFKEVVEDGIENKIFRPDADTDLIVATIIGTNIFFLKNKTFAESLYSQNTEEIDKEKYANTRIKNHLKLMTHSILEKKDEN